MSRSADAGDGRSFQSMTTPDPAGFPTVATELIARIWRGQTLATMADEYTKYLYEEGVCTIAKIPGNRGVQMLRMVDDATQISRLFPIGTRSRPSSCSRAKTTKRSILCRTIPNL